MDDADTGIQLRLQANRQPPAPVALGLHGSSATTSAGHDATASISISISISTKVLDRKKVIGQVSCEKSTSVRLLQYRSKIKIVLNVGMKERPRKRPPTLLLTK
jgi:hypothetical protein